MEILLDSADPIEVREVAAQGLISGVTTNPGLYAKAVRGGSFESRLRDLIEASPGHLFTQVIGVHDTRSMIEQARWLARQSDAITVKLPMSPEGILALRMLKQSDPPIRLAVTAVSSVAQALVAGMAGADVVALFNGPLDSVSDTPVELVGPVKRVFAHNGIGTKVLSCGRLPRGVGNFAAEGTDMITVRREYLDLLYQHPYTDQRLDGFMAAWRDAFGEDTWPRA